MARRFNGTTDLGTVTTGEAATFATLGITPANAGKRYSHPRPVRTADGNLLLLYSTNEDNTSGNYVIKAAISSDDGATFGTPILVGNTTSSGVDAFESFAVVLDDGTVVCVYGSGSSVYKRTSTDNGATWSAQSASITTGSGDPHPHLVRTGTTSLRLAYNSSGIKTRTSADNGATWSAESTITTDNVRDPNLCVAPNGDLLMVAANQTDLTGRLYRSTDGGATWSKSSTVYPNAVGGNSNPWLLTDGTTLWLTYSAGGDNVGATAGTRLLYAKASADSGVTWTNPAKLSTDATMDAHRAASLIVGGSPVGFCTNHKSDTDFHLARFAWPTSVVTAGRAGTVGGLDALTTFTAWAWVRHSTTYNAANNEFILSKNGFSKVLQLKNNSGAEFHCFVNRATTATDYKTAVNPTGWAADTWTFVATTYDNAAGAGLKAKFYIGTTPANLAAVAMTVVAEGSGTIVDDSAGPWTVGGKYADTARTVNGDVSHCGVANAVLTLAELAGVMVGTLPASAVGAWGVTGNGTSAERGLVGRANTLLLSGTTSVTAFPALVAPALSSDDGYPTLTLTWPDATFGTPPYTYDLISDGDYGDPIVTNATSPTAIDYSTADPGDTEDWQVRVTDADGNTALSNTVTYVVPGAGGRGWRIGRRFRRMGCRGRSGRR